MSNNNARLSDPLAILRGGKCTPSLLFTLESLLLKHPTGLSEYDLLKCLQGAYKQRSQQLVEVINASLSDLFSSLNLNDSLSLFQTHFVLFNGLYQLRQIWRKEHIGDIDIHTLNILPLPYNEQTTGSGLTNRDPLAEYYLDWNNLIGTSAASVESLLSCFWQQFCAAENGLGAYATVNQKQLEESYTLLEAEFNAPLKEVKRQYLRLIHQYHPDKGGDTEAAQSLQAAYTIPR
ncbi:DNA-J related domain-containing protein [Paraglaciecola chathamensis]|uniref:DNA-J related domain-containing protein n=1 Tax=Paraglaciecola chathamensis TaxID=368405 RepID=UPI002700C3AF|nr:DNA-J related domain-containing protein [Paraglaciecola chathamensis]MDO6559994.1 DNA-J related domain-containing protein [Paraglaciecola chathamensis]